MQKISYGSKLLDNSGGIAVKPASAKKINPTLIGGIIDNNFQRFERLNRPVDVWHERGRAVRRGWHSFSGNRIVRGALVPLLAFALLVCLAGF